MTRTTTLATLTAAALSLSACMSNDSAMSSDPQLTSGATNSADAETLGETVSTPTDGIENGTME